MGERAVNVLRWLPAILTVVVASATAQTNVPPADAAVAADQPIGFALVKQPTVVNDAGRGPLPTPARGETLSCTGLGREGYYVVCRDAANVQRFGTLPFRDEWGRATARGWTFDASLTPYTIVVENPLPLVAGAVRVEKGEEFPILGFDDRHYFVDFCRGETRLRLPIPKSVAHFKLPPDPVPPPPERELQNLLATNEAERTALTLRAKTAIERMALLTTLVEKTQRTQSENRALGAQADASEAACRALLTYVPGESVQREVADPRLPDATREAAELTARQAVSELDLSLVRDVIEKRREAEADIVKLKARLELIAAELKSLVDAANDTAVAAEKADLKVTLDQAVAEQGAKTAPVRREEARKAIIAALIEQIIAVRTENVRLDAQLTSLTNEVATLRQQLAEPIVLPTDTPAPPDAVESDPAIPPPAGVVPEK
jgi:hypothetical protein